MSIQRLSSNFQGSYCSSPRNLQVNNLVQKRFFSRLGMRLVSVGYLLFFNMSLQVDTTCVLTVIKNAKHLAPKQVSQIYFW